jgi:hypothetical protein
VKYLRKLKFNQSTFTHPPNFKFYGELKVIKGQILTQHKLNQIELDVFILIAATSVGCSGIGKRF